MAILGLALLTASCETTESCPDVPVVSYGKNLSYEKMAQSPPFTAKVEHIFIDRPFFLSAKSVEVWLKTPDSSRRLVLKAYPASPTVLGFVHSLHVCETYQFPQAYLDYANGSVTNSPAK